MPRAAAPALPICLLKPATPPLKLVCTHPTPPPLPQTSLPLLLPAVEAAIYNDNWRIRQASVELCGELLFKVRGPWPPCAGPSLGCAAAWGAVLSAASAQPSPLAVTTKRYTQVF